MTKPEAKLPLEVSDPASRANHSGHSGGRSPIRVIIADSQAIYRVGMSKIFAAEPDLEIAAQVEKLDELRTMGQSVSADVLLLEGGLLAGTPDALPEIGGLMQD